MGEQDVEIREVADGPGLPGKPVQGRDRVGGVRRGRSAVRGGAEPFEIDDLMTLHDRHGKALDVLLPADRLEAILEALESSLKIRIDVGFHDVVFHEI